MHTHTHHISSQNIQNIFSLIFCTLFYILFYTLFFSILLSILSLFSSEISYAENTQLENSEFSVSNAGGHFTTPTSFVISPKNQKKVYWSYIKNNPSNLHSTTEITRVFVPKSRNFYIFSDTSAVKKITFKIQKPIENRFFRIHTIDTNPAENFLPTITVENASPYSPTPHSFSMKGWKISGENFSIPLPDEELEAGEKRTFLIEKKNPENSSKKTISEILLISPTKRVRDRVKVPVLKRTEIFIRSKISEFQKTRITRPKFIITEKTL